MTIAALVTLAVALVAFAMGFAFGVIGTTLAAALGAGRD